MSLTVFPDIEQRSTEWYEVRRGIVTASVVGQLITPTTLKPASNDTSRALTALLVAERITGHTEPTWSNNDMIRGVVLEPVARDSYSKHHAQVTECGFMRRDGDDWSLGWSPDGMVGDDGAIEIKAPRAKTHLRTILSGEVPAQYVAQCQAALLVSGREWIDFVSFYGGLPLFVTRVLPEKKWFVAIEAACREFEDAARAMVADYERVAKHMPATERIPDELELVI